MTHTTTATVTFEHRFAPGDRIVGDVRERHLCLEVLAVELTLQSQRYRLRPVDFTSKLALWSRMSHYKKGDPNSWTYTESIERIDKWFEIEQP